MPKEQYPDIVVPTISVATVYVGNSPKDIENLVTRPIEKQLKGISGAKVKKITSTSQTDYSLIVVEFDTDVKTELAKQKVKDALDKDLVDYDRLKKLSFLSFLRIVPYIKNESEAVVWLQCLIRLRAYFF
jgi:hypothetical protein